MQLFFCFAFKNSCATVIDADDCTIKLTFCVFSPYISNTHFALFANRALNQHDVPTKALRGRSQVVVSTPTS